MQFDETFTRTPRARGAGCVIVGERGRVLLVQQARTAPGSWHLPMGTVEPGETPQDTALRETLEEARLEVELLGFVNAYLGVYDDGSFVLRFVWLARMRPGQVLDRTPDAEILDRCWFTLEQVKALYAQRQLRMHHTLLAVEAALELWKRLQAQVLPSN